MYVVKHSAEFGIDKQRVSAAGMAGFHDLSAFRPEILAVPSELPGIIVQGESAGGHLAVLASLLVPSGHVQLG